MYTSIWNLFCSLKKYRVHFPKGISSVQFSRSVMSDYLRPHESQHAKPPCPLPSPGVHSNSRPSSQWCHPAISSSVVPFFSCPQSLPASESFPMSQLFAWGGQSTGVSALASFLPMNTHTHTHTHTHKTCVDSFGHGSQWPLPPVFMPLCILLSLSVSWTQWPASND